MPEQEPIVFVLDDDASFRRSTERLIGLAGYKVRTFGSAREFLAIKRPEVPSCLVLDVRMPGLSGLELQSELSKAGFQIPIVFITAHGDIPMSVRAIKAGAVEFLTKPFREEELLEAIRQALEHDRAARDASARLAQLRECYDLLSPREREVMRGVVSGMLNKQIAADIGICEKTVKFHRAHIMQKMQAESVADLVRMADLLQRLPPRTNLMLAEGSCTFASREPV